MGLLFLVLLIAFIYAVTKRNNQENIKHQDNLQIGQQLEARDREWAEFIKQYSKSAKTPSEKALIARMMADVQSRGVPVTDGMPNIAVNTDLDAATAEKSALNFEAAKHIYEQTAAATETIKSKTQIQLDNASILLYFGAFLFVASTGLFVVFGGLSGGIRIIIVLLVLAIMYGSGIWLFHNRPKLKQAALAFVGIGMAIAPLVGLAAYNYLFNQTHARPVWLFTSVLSLALYTHALFTLRKPLINYIFIFTFLSLFESGVSIVNAKIYYFGWMMALVGIILSFISHIKGFWPEMQESTWTSSAVFLPIALLASIVLIPEQGAGQLGISLLLAAAYYGLETLHSKDFTQQSNAVAAQVTLLAGIGAVTYSISQSFPITASVLLVANLLQAGLVTLQPKEGALLKNFASIILASQITNVFIGWQEPNTVLVSAIGLVIIAAVIWLHQRRAEAYAIAALALLAVPAIYGQLVYEPHFSALTQIILLMTSLLVQFIVILTKLANFDKTNFNASAQTYLISSIIVVFASFWLANWPFVLITALVAFSALAVAHLHKDRDWAVAAGLFICAPLLHGWSVQPGAFLAAIGLALLLNIGLSLLYRTEANRWISTVLWLLLPLAFGNGILGSTWGVQVYAWAYLVITIGLVLSRAIARGVIMVSSKIPLESYARNTSFSYVFGYSTAASLAVFLALISTTDQIQPTILLLLLTPIIWIVSQKVEKRDDILTLLPLLLQAVLWSALRPAIASDVLLVYLVSSTLLGAVSYFGFSAWLTDKADEFIKNGSLISIFITPLSLILVTNTLWPMPVGLISAGALVYYYVRNQSQESREIALGLVTLGIFWLMGFWGITAIQAYVHVLIAQFAGYAYWRHLRGESQQSDNYLYLMLATATIPLAIQALSGQAGGLYGWWLLLEQILLMIIGMSIGRRVITMWGLYVAVGAVLYQLRNLGWAALTFLAVFLIGLAVYKIQKYNEKPS